jgi:hypothetical protein
VHCIPRGIEGTAPLPAQPRYEGKVLHAGFHVQFAPKKASQKGAASAPAPAQTAADSTQGGAGPSTSAAAEDPFSKLIEQARGAQADTRKKHGTRKEDKLQVAFGGGKSEALASGKPARGGDAGPSTSKGGALETQTYGRAVSKAKVLDDDDDLPLAQPGKEQKHKKERLPFLDADTYYPTLLPFQDVTEVHDSEALSRLVRPLNLAECEVCSDPFLCNRVTRVLNNVPGCREAAAILSMLSKYPTKVCTRIRTT